jgi:uncharacterized membrane protein
MSPQFTIVLILVAYALGVSLGYIAGRLSR